jgi:hypothetical protein
MGRACSMKGGEEECIQDIGGKACISMELVSLLVSWLVTIIRKETIQTCLFIEFLCTS